MPSHALVQVAGEPDREIPLPPGSSVEALPSVLVAGAEAPGVVIQGSGPPVRIHGRILETGQRRLLRPGEAALVSGVRIVAGSEGPGTATQARSLLLAALRGEEPDRGPGLLVLAGPDAGRRFPLRCGVLGRGEAADFRLGDPSLSRSHARIHLDGGRVLLEDLGSKNGLWLRGRRLPSLREIHPGEEVRAGRTVLALGVAAPAGAGVADPAPDRGGRSSRRLLARAVLAVAVLAAAAAAALVA